MPSDPTQHQSDEDRQQSAELSRERKRPPSEVSGYEIDEFLGSGAYGEVWVATDLNTRRKVAIKFYAHRGGLDWSLLSREVEKLVFLSADRYVVQLLDVGWDATPPYYVMEYVERGSLDKYIAEQGTLSLGEAVEIFRDVAVGLTHAHDKGVLHCDLKPANVLIDQDTKARLADFGQSRLSTEQAPALGTLYFMAPEQADLSAIPDARWDVYALGALLYCMIVGEPPHRDAAFIQELNSIKNLDDRLAAYRDRIGASPPPVLHRNVAGIDRSLVEIIDQALEIDPADRFANVQAVVEALQLRDLARQRRPLLMLGLVGPALLLIIMSLFGWWGYAGAVGGSEATVTKRARESNQFAAQFAALLVSQQIDRYYRAVNQVAEDPGFLERISEVYSDPELAKIILQLRDPKLASDEQQKLQLELRDKMRDHPARQGLQAYIDALMVDRDLPAAASWFVNDRHGTQVSIKLENPQATPTLGKNYGWRTYFQGGNRDRDPDWRPQGDEHIQTTHISAVFKSRATRTWKVAVSTPIELNGEFVGVVALTVEIGHIMQFDGSKDQFAILFDDREGDHQGVILQHPLFDTFLNENEKLPKEFSTYRAPPLKADTLYEDPFGDYKDSSGKPIAGVDYKQQWIAADEPVELTGRLDAEGKRTNIDTGLRVRVQDAYDSTIGPIHDLGALLVRLGLTALGVVIAVITLLWYFVVRLLGDSNVGKSKSAGTSPPTPLHAMSTLPQSGRKR